MSVSEPNPWRYTVTKGAEYPEDGRPCDIAVRGYLDAPEPQVRVGAVFERSPYGQPYWWCLKDEILPGFPKYSYGCGHVYAWRYSEVPPPPPQPKEEGVPT